MPDPIRKRFSYGQLWPLRPACSHGQAGLIAYMPEHAWFILCKTDPDPIWMAWSGFWPNSSGPEASRCAGIIGPGFWQDANGPLPVSHFPTRFRFSTDVPDNTVQNQPGSGLVLADQTDPVRKQAGVQQSSGPLLATASQPIQSECGMFTELVLAEGEIHLIRSRRQRIRMHASQCKSKLIKI